MESIHQLDVQDWPILRQLRLASLADAPDAFWSTLEEESRYGKAEWSDFLGRVGWFVASRERQAFGLAGGLRRSETTDEIELIGMWVQPAERRRGVAARLVGAVCEWSSAQGATSVVLWVTESNPSARLLYESLGFQPTGERAGPTLGRTGQEERMRIDLTGRPAVEIGLTSG